MPQAAPMNQPAKVALVSPPEWRDNIIRGPGHSKDAQLINCVGELIAHRKKYVIRKRPGAGPVASFGQPLVTGPPLGMFAVDQTLMFAAGGNVQLNPGVSAVAGTTQYQFQQVQAQGLFWKNTTNAYITSGFGPPPFTVVPITDPQYPAITVPGMAYLDGTLYVMDHAANIWGSDLNNAQSWTTVNKIVAQNEPDFGVALVKHLVYVLALKQWTTEVFYDAGNPTGSPLLPVPEALMNYGCSNPYTVQDMDGTKFWLTGSKQVQPQVLRLDGLTPSIVSTPAVERLLINFTVSSSNLGPSTTSSFVLKVGGHRYYGMTDTAANLTIVYDIDQQLWYRWTDHAGNYWPFTGNGWIGANLAGATFTQPTAVLQHLVTGAITTIDADYVFPTDNGVSYAADIYTERMDMSIDRTKQLSGMHVNADIGDMTILVRYSDNDYQTWSQPRYINLGNPRPYLDNFGSFYRRAFHFRIQNDQPLRTGELDLQFDVGPA